MPTQQVPIEKADRIEYRFHRPTTILPNHTLLYRIPAIEHTQWTHFRVHYFNAAKNEVIEDLPRIRLARESTETIQPFGRARGVQYFREPITAQAHAECYLVITDRPPNINRVVLYLYGTSEERT